MHSGVNAMLALEMLGRRAYETKNRWMLAVCVEAWERGGWCVAYYDVAPERDVMWARRCKNRAKLRHEALTLLAAIELMPLSQDDWARLKWAEQDAARGRFKYAMHSGPHPTLVVACPTCESPAGYFCNDDDGKPIDGPHNARRMVAGTATA